MKTTGHEIKFQRIDSGIIADGSRWFSITLEDDRGSEMVMIFDKMADILALGDDILSAVYELNRKKEEP